jgi:hypothetical protein
VLLNSSSFPPTLQKKLSYSERFRTCYIYRGCW